MRKMVWILWYQIWDDQIVMEGVYSDKETAEKHLSKIKKDVLWYEIEMKYVRYT